MDNSIDLLVAGDVLFQKKQDICFSNEVKEIIGQHDWFCCNLEGPVESDGQKESLDEECKIFQTKEGVDALISNGVTIMALANNHIMNYGFNGLKNTLKLLEQKNVLSFGAGLCWDEAYKPIVIKKNDITVALVNVADPQYGTCGQYGGRGYADCLDYRAYKVIKDLCTQCDHVIVVCHAGLEDVEIPLPEWRENYKRYIDCGVSCVIAHHPHVLQGWENYREGKIYYSLGNFIWDSIRVKSCTDPTIMVSLKISKDEIVYREYPVVYSTGRVELVNDKDTEERIKRLCDILHDDKKYMERVNAGCELIYNRWYKNKFFSLVEQSPWDNIKHVIKNIVMFMMRGFKEDDRKIYLFCVSNTMQYVLKRVIPRKGGWDSEHYNDLR